LKTRKPTQAKSARKPSDAIIAKRYLDLQKLRDEVRKAESSCGLSLNASQTTPDGAGIEDDPGLHGVSSAEERRAAFSLISTTIGLQRPPSAGLFVWRVGQLTDGMENSCNIGAFSSRGHFSRQCYTNTAGLTMEETIEFEALDALPPFDDSGNIAWSFEGGPVTRREKRWLELYLKDGS
jgi:hypothetical protein